MSNRRTVPGTLSSRLAEARLARGQMGDVIAYLRRMNEASNDAGSLAARSFESLVIEPAYLVAEHLETIMSEIVDEGDKS